MSSRTARDKQKNLVSKKTKQTKPPEHNCTEDCGKCFLVLRIVITINITQELQHSQRERVPSGRVQSRDDKELKLGELSDLN